jgi:hypothetical protein
MIAITSGRAEHRIRADDAVELPDPAHDPLRARILGLNEHVGPHPLHQRKLGTVHDCFRATAGVSAAARLAAGTDDWR